MTHTLKYEYSIGHQVQLTLLRNYLRQSGFLSQKFTQSEVFLHVYWQAVINADTFLIHIQLQKES